VTFDEAAEALRKLSNVKDDDKLLAYGLFKQGKEGDNSKTSPWKIQLTEHAKWKAWEAQRGKSQSAAQKEYIMHVKSLLASSSS